MSSLLNIKRSYLAFGIPLSLLVVLIVLIKSSPITGGSPLNVGITIDLLLTVPLVYFLLIRKTEIPKTTVVPVMVVGLLVGSYFLPKESQTYLILFKTWALPLIEISVLTFVIFKVRGALKAYHKLKGATLDFFDAVKNTCYGMFPKRLVLPLATEIAVFYYVFINWKTRPLRENEFTYHKKSGTATLFGAILLIIAAETFVFHFLLASWNIVVAWVLTALSIYTAIQVLGFARSLSKRPIAIHEDKLALKYGILNEVEIPLADIERSWKPLKEDALSQTLSPLGEMESHNVIIYLRKAHELVGLYGTKKRFKIIGLHIDEPKDFKDRLEQGLQQS